MSVSGSTLGGGAERKSSSDSDFTMVEFDTEGSSNGHEVVSVEGADELASLDLEEKNDLRRKDDYIIDFE